MYYSAFIRFVKDYSFLIYFFPLNLGASETASLSEQNRIVQRLQRHTPKLLQDYRFLVNVTWTPPSPIQNNTCNYVVEKYNVRHGDPNKKTGFFRKFLSNLEETVRVLLSSLLETSLLKYTIQSLTLTLYSLLLLLLLLLLSSSSS